MKTSKRVLVFDGEEMVEVVEVANKQPPSRMSMRMLVFDGGGVGGGKQATIIETEHTRAHFRWWRGSGGGKN